MKALKLCALSLLLAVSSAMAQTTTTTSTTTTTGTAPKPATSTVTSDRLTTEFSGWAGSPENSTSLVTGLRSGTPITLTEPGSAGTAATTTFSPTTKPMGYGNIRIALSLARAQLASQGITSPTAAELQGALVGTPDGMTQGVLQMRASGMGWGQIANSMGFKLGAVMSGKQTFTTATATATASATTTATGASASTNAGQTRKGVVTAGGSQVGGSANGKSGVTSAAGGAGKVTTGLGHAYGHAGGGVVNAGGVKTGGAAGNNAGGNAGGNGKGSGKS